MIFNTQLFTMRAALALALALTTNAGLGPQAKALDSAPDDNYPRITAMETAILGTAYQTEALSDRLTRMEQKAFGKVSDKADLSDRTDALQDYVENKLHKKLLAPGPQYESAEDMNAYGYTGDGQNQQNQQPTAAASSSSAAASSSASARSAPQEQTQYPRVTALEEAILGQAHEGDQLSDRLSRMEIKAFGHDLPKSALGDRTDALEDYAEKKLHKKILGQSSAPNDPAGADTGTSSAGGAGGGNFLTKMGGALLGIQPAGPGSSGGPSFFVPGFGGFGGVRVRPRSAVTSANSDPDSSQINSPAPIDDAVVNAPTPPPANARLITKVGWCEKHVFGVVYHDKHLTERLNILNDALKFDPGKKGMALMDDVDKLMKAAELKSPAQPL
ncbi:MAG TPA: hypothetical protein PL112_04565 [Candidatus Obscuribacter sp.]|nr:hypothetical protein [Candidatus Obscuribacter sp.]HND66040.1 hypothetical protein [Candidatus Obscuribacter sp.]